MLILMLPIFISIGSMGFMGAIGLIGLIGLIDYIGFIGFIRCSPDDSFNWSCLVWLKSASPFIHNFISPRFQVFLSVHAQTSGLQ